MAKHVLLTQLNTVMQGMAEKNDARFRKLSDPIAKTDLATALSDEIDAKLDEADLGEYAIEQQATAETGFISTYQLFKTVGTGQDAVKTAAGPKINIPKDFLVKSVSLETATAANASTVGVAEGEAYIDFVVNTKDAVDGTGATHLYLGVQDLIDVYTPGNGINIVNNAVSVAIDATNANGLSVGANGLAMAVADSSTTGALSSTDWSTFNGKQNALTAGTAIDATSFASGTLNVVAATASTSGVGGNAGTMSAADKEKLDGIEVATAQDIQDIINGLYVPAQSEDPKEP